MTRERDRMLHLCNFAILVFYTDNRLIAYVQSVTTWTSSSQAAKYGMA